MKEKISDRRNKRYVFTVGLGCLALALFILVSISGASPFAYITNIGSSTVSVIDTAINAVPFTMPVGLNPYGVAVTPDGTKAYITNIGDNTVSVIDTATNTVTSTVPVGSVPYGAAITPSGAKAYITNFASNTVSVIDTATNTVVATVPVGPEPYGVAVTPDGTKAYIANYLNNAVSVIDTAANTVITTVPVGSGPIGVAITPDGKKAYITNYWAASVSVIDTATNAVTMVSVGIRPVGVAVTPDGTKAYIANYVSNTVSVIDTAANTVITTVPVGPGPIGVAVTSDGTKAYVANYVSNTVSIIDTATNTVTTNIPVGTSPVSFGKFIGPSINTPSETLALSVSKVAQANGTVVQQVNPGQTFSYNVTIANKDLANDAQHVVVTDKLPSEVEYLRAVVYPTAPADYSINQSGDLVYVRFDQIPAASTRYINITIKAPTQGPTTLYNIVNIRYRNDQNLSDNRMTLATYVPQLGYNQTEAAFSSEDLLHNQSQLLFQFEDLLHTLPCNSSTNYTFLVSFEQLLRSQAALTSSFEDLLSNESSTGWDDEYSEENRTALLWSYEQMLYDEAFLFASFDAKLNESWNSLCGYTQNGHTQDAQTELIASFEDLLKRQTRLYKSFNLLLNRIDIDSHQDMIDFLAAYENLLRVEANLLMSFNELLAKKYEKSCSACVCPQGCKYASIQAAIDAASPGDTICVAQGTYNENIVIDKSLNILGAGADRTTVNGLGLPGSVFTIGKTNPDIQVTLSNVKITQGQAEGGGGIYNACNLTIDGCSITNNAVTEHGGGIWNGFNKLIARDSVISDNQAGIYGGGIHNNGPMIVEHCTLSNNQAGLIYGGHGGGVSNAYDFAFITDSVISGNSAQVGGGITDYYGGTVTIAGCKITGNNGGGISIWNFGGYVGTVKFITSTGTEMIWPSYDTQQLYGNNPSP